MNGRYDLERSHAARRPRLTAQTAQDLYAGERMGDRGPSGQHALGIPAGSDTRRDPPLHMDDQERSSSSCELLTATELAELEASPQAVYGLWPDLTLAYVNPVWREFVDRHEGALALARHWALGAIVLDAVDEDLRPFYQRVLHACLSKGRRWSHEFECSGRRKACRYRIDIRPLPAQRGLIVAHAALVECPHAFAPCCVPRTDLSRYLDEHGFVVQCVHCRRVRAAHDHERWDLVPAWVERTPDQASGGLCETCARLHFPSLVPEPRPASARPDDDHHVPQAYARSSPRRAARRG